MSFMFIRLQPLHLTFGRKNKKRASQKTCCMIALDTNTLVYATRAEYPFHMEAHRALSELSSSGGRWTIPWPCAHEFLGVVTDQKFHRPPKPHNMAMQFLKNCAAFPSFCFIGEGRGYMDILDRLLLSSTATGAMIHDAKIAAICIHHGVSERWSADRYFSRFPKLKTRNPLVKK
jgi:predicted nucleic acid-binding protein